MHLMRIMSSCKAIRIDPSILLARPNDKKGPEGNVCGTIFINNMSGQWNVLRTVNLGEKPRKKEGEKSPNSYTYTGNTPQLSYRSFKFSGESDSIKAFRKEALACSCISGCQLSCY